MEINLLSHIGSLILVSEQLKQELISSTIKKQILKGEIIVNANNYCRDMFFVEKGLLRGYYYQDGKEITNWFAQENEFATCFYSFVSQKESFETIQALEDSEVVQISYNSMQLLFNKFPETERIGRIITENYYVKLEERLLNIQFKSAKERYLNILESKTSLVQRAPLGHIATYLGISQETLSRMRAEL